MSLQIIVYNLKSRLSVYSSHILQVTSTWMYAHYCQLIISGKFQMFDYGSEENIKHYNQSTPPSYHLDRITSDSIAIFHATNDYLSDNTDVDILLKKLTGN